MDSNDQTGARLAETHISDVPSSAAHDDKDLPPSYESLFPSAPTRWIHLIFLDQV